MKKTKSLRMFLPFILVSAFVLCWLPERFEIAFAADSGSISGKVTADHGAVHAVRVKAKDTTRKIAYTVFTRNGRYQIFNLLPGNYQVFAMQDGFKSTTQSVDLGSGETKTADVALTENGPSGVELVDFDTLYPPGPGRDLLTKECAGCHGWEHIPWHKMGGRTEDQWRTAVNRMFEVNRVLVPIVPPEAVSLEQREIMIKYFASAFGPDSKRRDLKLDEIPLDEEALSKAIYIEYDLPPAIPGRTGQRGIHDLFPSQISPTVFIGDIGTGAVLAMDLRNKEYPSRFKEWPIGPAGQKNPQPHGMIESKGHIYWTELSGGNVGELDPNTGEMHRFAMPNPGSPHTPRADSQGNVWFTSVYNNKIGRLDAETKTVAEFDPSPNYKNAHYYGLIVDRKDRVWATGTTSHTIVMFDPHANKWTTYPTPTQPSGARRPTVDSKGKIWFSEHVADAIGMLDPDTGKIVEYKSPLRHSGEYECYADKEDNIWVTFRAYGTFGRFDQKTKKYTFFPFPEIKGHTPKIETDPEGTLWFSMGTPSTVANLRINGNVPAGHAAGM
jgi:streptogramin lyase